MATKIPVPKLGQSEETVTIASWQVKEGDAIKKGDVLFQVETDKAVLDVESQFEGTILKIVTPAGVEVPVMTTAAIIGAPGEEIPAEMLAAAPKAAPAAVAAGETAVNSPMPGNVFKVECKVGDSVKAGDVLVVLEAMKMEIEVSAPVDGTVKSVSATVGTTVNTDDLLVTLG